MNGIFSRYQMIKVRAHPRLALFVSLPFLCSTRSLKMATSVSSTTTVATAPNIDGMLLLEAPFARAPHDELRRQLRSQQRLVERDLTACSSSLASMAKTSQPSNVKKEEDEVQMIDATADASFTGDISFMTEGRADESIMTAGDVDEDGEGDTTKEKTSDLEKSLDMMLGRLKGLKRKVSRNLDTLKVMMLTDLNWHKAHLSTRINTIYTDAARGKK